MVRTFESHNIVGLHCSHHKFMQELLVDRAQEKRLIHV